MVQAWPWGTLTTPVILASTSRTRAEKLRKLGIPFTVVPPFVDETPLKGERAGNCATRLAKQKAQSVAKSHPNTWIVAADSIISVGRRLVGKAEDAAIARRNINLLTGRRHRAYTALVVVAPDGSMRVRLAMAHVSVKNLCPAEKEAFVASKEWEGAAGYRLEGLMGLWVRGINGSIGAIEGMPVEHLYSLMVGGVHLHPLKKG